MFSNIGIMELVVLFIIALFVFGPSKLPEMGKAVGSALKEFKNAASGIMDDEKNSNRKK